MTKRILPFGLVLVCSAAAAAQGVTTIDVPGSTATIALGINDAGTVVGRYVSAADNRTHGFLRTPRDEFTSIDVPGAVFTVAAAINNDDVIVGQYRLSTDSSATRHGFLFANGQFLAIDPPGSQLTNVLGIGPSGIAVGRYCTTLPCTPDSPTVHGFIYADGEYTTFDISGALGTNAWKISPQGHILGGYTAADGSKNLFVAARAGVMTVELPSGLPVGLDTGGINAEGDVVGFYCDAAPCVSGATNAHGFLIAKDGQFQSIDITGARFTALFSVNARGDMVGLYGDASGQLHGVLLRR